jgi:hypothetical protein
MATRKRRTTARSRSAGKTTAKKGRTTAAKKTARKRPPRKTAARKAAAASRPAKRKAGTRKTTAAELRKRAAAAEETAEQVESPDTETLAVSIGGLEVPDLDLGKIEGAVRDVMDFVEENPVAAAAMALGAGAVLTSMYWDKASGGGKK